MPDSKSLDSDLAAVRALAEVLDDTGLTEIEMERGSLRLRVAKTITGVAAPMPAMAPMQAPAATPAAAPTTAPGTAPNAGGADFSQHPGAVTSPMVGTVYTAPSPGAAAFITEGAQVSAGQTVMIIEAMKTMNEIKAPKAGKVTQIFARDAEPVEFGEVLLIVE